MKIQIAEPDGPYCCEMDTDVMKVTIFNAFNGATFVDKNGDKLSISLRDNGFEVKYEVNPAFSNNEQWFSFQNGQVQRMEAV